MNEFDRNLWTGGALVTAVGIKMYESQSAILHNIWIFVQFILAMCGIFGTIFGPLYFVHWYSKKKEKEKRQLEEKIRDQEKEYQELITKFERAYQTNDMVQCLNNLNLFAEDAYPQAVRGFEEFNNTATEKIRAQQNEEELQRRAGERFKAQVQVLTKFKIEKQDTEALPVDKLHTQSVIEEAEKEAERHFKYQRKKEATRKEAIQYYQTHSLDMKPNLDSWEDGIYTQIRQEVQEGKIELHNTVVSQPQEAVDVDVSKRFYHAKGISPGERSILLENRFLHVRGVDLEGRPAPGGFYIRKHPNQKESPTHFVMKHLITELHPNLRSEVPVDGRYADVTSIRKPKIAVEVETGANKDEDLKSKVEWLNKNFEQWIIVCRRRHLKRYNQLVDSQKSFCLTPKKAKEKILELMQDSRTDRISVRTPETAKFY
ncbi:MAG: hypothetical protein ACE5FT_03745 [Candidatus Nanoarchaeia archaeon]